MKLKKSKSINELRKELWRLLSKWIRLVRDKNICYTCGNRGNEAGHYIPRSKRSSLYFDERNVHCQCTTCNRFMSGNLARYAINLEKEYGMGILQEFDRLKQEVWMPSHNELQERIDEYKARLRNAI